MKAKTLIDGLVFVGAVLFLILMYVVAPLYFVVHF